MLLNYDLGSGITAFSTTRHGGVSQGNYASFNANHYCGDLPEHVAANRKLLAEALGITHERIIVPHQTHSVNVARIVDEHTFRGDDPCRIPNLEDIDPCRIPNLEAIDAVITDQPGLCLCVSTADCIPVLLYDPTHHAIAAIHAGWRGTVGRIVQRTIERMVHDFGTIPTDLKAVIGPGISLQSFEVGDEVYASFQEALFPMERIARRFPSSQGSSSQSPSSQGYSSKSPSSQDPTSQKWHIDLWEANRFLLCESGLRDTLIHTAGICTFIRHHDFFSARRLGIKSGRILTGILMS